MWPKSTQTMLKRTGTNPVSRFEARVYRSTGTWQLQVPSRKPTSTHVSIIPLIHSEKEENISRFFGKESRFWVYRCTGIYVL